MFLAFYTNLAEFLGTRSGIFAALIPLIAAMALIKWWDSKLGVPPYASLRNEQKIWLTLHFLPPQASARTASCLGEEKLRICMDSSKETADSTVRYKKELIDDFLDRYDKLGKEDLDLSIVGCSDAFEALAHIYENREEELSACLLAVWPLQEDKAAEPSEKSSAGEDTDPDAKSGEAASDKAVPADKAEPALPEAAAPKAEADKSPNAEANEASVAEEKAEPSAAPADKETAEV
ncbi:hypothetical protein IJT93_06030 [bacterium]|nr:hypothetical protein [bacterium]